MEKVAQLIAEFGFPVVLALGMGYFIYFVWKFVTETVSKERIREELREGRSPQQAIHHGYDSAFSTILDANITTFIAGLILFAVGTGPIKGFSITLMIGIATSMFTAILVTRVIVNAVWGGKRVEKLAI